MTSGDREGGGAGVVLRIDVEGIVGPASSLARLGGGGERLGDLRAAALGAVEQRSPPAGVAGVWRCPEAHEFLDKPPPPSTRCEVQEADATRVAHLHVLPRAHSARDLVPPALLGLVEQREAERDVLRRREPIRQMCGLAAWMRS